MARFLLAWELGGGMVHLVPLAQVAQLPMQVEQLLQARRVHAAGAGEVLIGADVAGQFLPALSRVLGDTGLRQHAQALAARHAPTRFGDVTQHVAERCIALAAAAVPAGTGC